MVRRRARRRAGGRAVEPVLPPAPRLAMSAGVRVGDDPAESLRSVRRAMVGRWWLQVSWRDGVFRAEAHTLSGMPGVWVGTDRASIGEATDDAIQIIGELRNEQ